MSHLDDNSEDSHDDAVRVGYDGNQEGVVRVGYDGNQEGAVTIISNEHMNNGGSMAIGYDTMVRGLGSYAHETETYIGMSSNFII